MFCQIIQVSSQLWSHKKCYHHREENNSKSTIFGAITEHCGLCFRGPVTGWRRLRRQPKFCEHERVGGYVQAVAIGNQEFLAVSCIKCEVIRLYNMETEDVTTAFYDSSYHPGGMCQGDPGQMYVAHVVYGAMLILQLNCSTAEFTLRKTIQSGVDDFYAMCYIPTYKLVAISNNTPGNCTIRAVSLEHEKIWEFSGQVEGIPCKPHGMMYYPAQDCLFVADGDNTRLLVLNAGDGSLRQIVPLSKAMGTICNLSLHSDQIVVWHQHANKVKVSHFSLQ